VEKNLSNFNFDWMQKYKSKNYNYPVVIPMIVPCHLDAKLQCNSLKGSKDVSTNLILNSPPTIFLILIFNLILNSHGAGDNLENFLRYRGLTGTIVLLGKILLKVLGVVRCTLHGLHTCSKL